jgi:O-antigen ligase
MLAVVNFDHATVPCQGYCPLGPAFSGVFQNENLLATALVASLPFIYLGFRGRLRLGLLLYVAAMVVATASRGAIATAVIIIGALLVLRPQLDGVRPRPWRTAIAGLMLAASLFAASYIVVRDTGFSNYHLDDRVQLWSVASTYTDKSPLFGWGPNTWETMYTDRGLIPSSTEHSTHNQFVDVLYRAGWVGLAVLFAMMVALVRSAGPARSAVLLALTTVFLIGASERAWSIGTIDFASFSLIATLMLGPAAAAGPARAARRIGRSSSATRAHVMVGGDGAR